MVARSAYAQLRYSPLLLAGTSGRHGAHLFDAVLLRPSATASPSDRYRHLVDHGGGVSTDVAILPVVSALGPLLPASRSPTWSFPRPPINMPWTRGLWKGGRRQANVTGAP